MHVSPPRPQRGAAASAAELVHPNPVALPGRAAHQHEGSVRQAGVAGAAHARPRARGQTMPTEGVQVQTPSDRWIGGGSPTARVPADSRATWSWGWPLAASTGPAGRRARSAASAAGVTCRRPARRAVAGPPRWPAAGSFQGQYRCQSSQLAGSQLVGLFRSGAAAWGSVGPLLVRRQDGAGEWGDGALRRRCAASGDVMVNRTRMLAQGPANSRSQNSIDSKQIVGIPTDPVAKLD